MSPTLYPLSTIFHCQRESDSSIYLCDDIRARGFRPRTVRVSVEVSTTILYAFGRLSDRLGEGGNSVASARHVVFYHAVRRQ